MSCFVSSELEERATAGEEMVTMSGRNRGLGKANEPKFICQICGDVAAGFHCGAFVCEACKVGDLFPTPARMPYPAIIRTLQLYEITQG